MSDEEEKQERTDWSPWVPTAFRLHENEGMSWRKVYYWLRAQSGMRSVFPPEKEASFVVSMSRRLKRLKNASKVRGLPDKWD